MYCIGISFILVLLFLLIFIIKFDKKSNYFNKIENKSDFDEANDIDYFIESQNLTFYNIKILPKTLDKIYEKLFGKLFF